MVMVGMFRVIVIIHRQVIVVMTIIMMLRNLERASCRIVVMTVVRPNNQFRLISQSGKQRENDEEKEPDHL